MPVVEKSKELFELRKQLKFLKGLRGSGTELISLYIPPKYPLAEVTGKLREEYGQAGNIKSKSTRTNVQAALEKIMGHLKMYREPPANGMAVFCGNVSKVEGKPDVRLFAIVPPEPLGVQFYRCDSAFVLEPLEGMLAAKEAYGLVVLDGRDATIALLTGKTTRVVKRLHSMAHAKLHGKGGQSARRYQRIIEEEIETYYKRVGESMDEAFLGVQNLKGIIVGGPGPAKDSFLKARPFNYQLKILGVVDTGYTDEYGLREVLEKSGEIIAEQELIKEKALLDRFMKEVTGEGLATYGEKEVREALQSGKAELLLVSEGLELKRVKMKCSNCGQEVERITTEEKEEAHACGGKLEVKEAVNIGEELVALAEEKDIPIEMISTDTAEGVQFLKGFYGVGAFLRYK
ncbi:MAG: peptide chain release factor aRF-1 [Candidatus Micrarchaeia archaeon]